METEVLKLINNIKDVATNIVQKDIETVRGFSENQLKAIAKQTVLIQKSVLAGEIDEDLKVFFYQGLEAMVRNFVTTLAGLLTITIEKLWNGIVEVLENFLNKIIP